MPESTFQVGDVVRKTWNKDKGVILKVDPEDTWMTYKVKFPKCTAWFNASELILIKRKE